MGIRLTIAAAGAALALALSACGGGDDDGDQSTRSTTQRTTTPSGGARGGVGAADVAVIRAWADALRRGDVEGAARRFSLPAAVANGTRPVPLDTRAQVKAFNRSLPCGAVLLRTRSGGHGLIVATFRLTERRGPGGGSCGAGTGRTAQTAFVIDDGLITHWLRVQDLPAAPGVPA